MGNWIAKATSKHKGAFKAKAKKAGMSTAAYAAKESGAPGTTGKQARLAQTLMGLAHVRASAKASGSLSKTGKRTGATAGNPHADAEKMKRKSRMGRVTKNAAHIG